MELRKLMADCGFPLSKDLLHWIAQDVLNENNNNTNKPQYELGVQWVDRFLT